MQWRKRIFCQVDKSFLQKKVEFLPVSLKTMCEQWFLKQLQMYKRTFTKFTCLSTRIYRFCETLRTLLAFRIFLDKINLSKLFFNLNCLSTFQFQVGPTYGWKMMTGYLAQKHDVHVGNKSFGKALAKVCLQHHVQRKTNTAKSLNPIPYRSDYFGHKRHMDQKEKLVIYGVTHILAIDGHSRFIASFSTMPIKNNAIIYDKVYVFNSLEFQTLFEEIPTHHTFVLR